MGTKLINALDTNEKWSILADIKGKKISASNPMSDLHSHFSTILNNVSKNVGESTLNSLKEKISGFLENRINSDITVSVPIGNYSTFKLCKLAKKLKNGKSAFKDGV